MKGEVYRRSGGAYSAGVSADAVPTGPLHHRGDTIQEENRTASLTAAKTMASKTTVRSTPKVVNARASLPLDTSLFAAGDRVCVAVSGGADSTALLRALLARRKELGIVLSVLHVEHGLRGQAAVEDAAFVRALAEQFDLPCEIVAVDTPQRMAEQKQSVETAARVLRYQVFRDVLAAGKADKVATAHTLDDQAETVLMKLLRGAWTEGLSGIHPVLQWGEAGARTGRNGQASGQSCVRPFLAVQRGQIEAYLRALDQPWRQDETNLSPAHTRNRIRHELLPKLRAFNPQIDSALAHIAENARAEEQHWQAELDRLLPLLFLPGKPTRGGGRSVSTAPGLTEVAMEIARLRELDPGLLRRVLRAAAERAGATLDFDTTDRLLAFVDLGANGPARRGRLDLTGGVVVERSARELRFGRSPAKGIPTSPVYALPVPGTVDAPAFRARYTATVPQDSSSVDAGTRLPDACVRAWQPGDRVELLHSRGPKKVKEVLSRMLIPVQDRASWPVVAWRGQIIWMRGVTLAKRSGTSREDGHREDAVLPAPDVRETRD
ncbi:MAG: tRNA lysidine(34) synthetase TilS [Acidobacteriaceae bacterium]